VHDLKKTFFGDADLDGEFTSRDLVNLFQAGTYEDGLPGNSTWETGDWNGDRNFTSSDLVLAFQDGGYEQGPRASDHAVPEPDLGGVYWAMGLLWCLMIGGRPHQQHRQRAGSVGSDDQ
jgi:hypothetical protein